MEIFTLTEESLQPVVDVSLYGRVAVFRVFRPHVEFHVTLNFFE